MAESKLGIFQKVDACEIASCLALNRLCQYSTIARFFSLVSRLGDGVFWYVLMLVMALVDGSYGIYAALHMGVVSVVGVIIYKGLKHKLVRQRPFISNNNIVQGTYTLDYYSFPSGHTLHAVSFTFIAVAYYPWLAPLLVPFATFVALSRVILGLHYPTDVLVGAVIGWMLAVASFQLI